jgi:hypothetical protein
VPNETDRELAALFAAALEQEGGKKPARSTPPRPGRPAGPPPAPSARSANPASVPPAPAAPSARPSVAPARGAPVAPSAANARPPSGPAPDERPGLRPIPAARRPPADPAAPRGATSSRPSRPAVARGPSIAAPGESAERARKLNIPASDTTLDSWTSSPLPGPTPKVETPPARPSAPPGVPDTRRDPVALDTAEVRASARPGPKPMSAEELLAQAGLGKKGRPPSGGAAPKKSLPPTSGARAEDLMASVASSARSLPPTSGAKSADLGASAVPLGPDGEPLIDHRGRSRPLYKARRPKPAARWKPPWALDVLLGLVPGARMMVHGEVARGIVFTVVGLVTLVPAIVVMASWARRTRELELLAIAPRWMLVPFVVLVATVLAFEGLRLASELDRLKRSVTASRVIGSLLVPSLAVLFFGPRVVAHAQSVVEPMWFGALVTAASATAAGLWSTLHERGDSGDAGPDRRVLIAGAVGIVVLVAVLVVSLASGSTLPMLASASADAGFVWLPSLLGG